MEGATIDPPQKPDRIDRTVEAAAWAAYRADASDGNRNRLIELYDRLIWWHAFDIAGRLASSATAAELYSYAFEGVCAAIAAFDQAKGVKFTTYMGHRVRWTMLDGVRCRIWPNRSANDRRRRLTDAADSFAARTGRPPTDEELAAAMKVRPARLPAFKTPRLASIEEPMPNVDTASNRLLTFSRAMPATGAEPGSTLQRRDFFKFMLASLPAGDRAVLVMYYADGLTLKEVGRAMGLSESAVSLRLNKSIAHLRRAHGGRRDRCYDAHSPAERTQR